MKIGKGVFFLSVDDYTAINRSSSYRAPVSLFSFCFWVLQLLLLKKETESIKRL